MGRNGRSSMRGIPQGRALPGDGIPGTGHRERLAWSRVGNGEWGGLATEFGGKKITVDGEREVDELGIVRWR